MVTLVSFLLTIFTEFRQLTTNLQALCSLTARIKKAKPQSKNHNQSGSWGPQLGSPRGGLLWAPAEPWTEGPAGAKGVLQSGGAGLPAAAVNRQHRQRRQPTTRVAQPAHVKPPQHKSLKAVHCTEEGCKFSEQWHTHHHTTVPAPYRVVRSLCYLPLPENSLHPGKWSRKNKKCRKNKLTCGMEYSYFYVAELHLFRQGKIQLKIIAYMIMQHFKIENYLLYRWRKLKCCLIRQIALQNICKLSSKLIF